MGAAARTMIRIGDDNRAPLEMIFEFALEQQVITSPPDLATVFAAPYV